MSQFPRPRIVVSKCLGFAPCRWNGVTIPDEFVSRLEPHVEFVPVCAEVEIGLGAPRDPVRVVSVEGDLRLVQPATGKDFTDIMRRFARDYVAAVGVTDGFILKSRSPSCGIKDVKVYPGAGKMAASGKGTGFFAAAVLERFGDLPVEDEGRLTNFAIREHFLTRIFALARLREALQSGAMRDLVAFHARHKLLLMAYNQTELGALGRIVANPQKRPFADVAADYEAHFRRALLRPPRMGAIINVLMHALGYFSDSLSAREKAFFLDSLERYRARKIPLSAVTAILRSWIVRFDNAYLAEQVFFDPYPEALAEVTDSGKGRELG
ncbi:MAG: DUF523 and DUF1722 domain-containing protein [Anaerolineae bacterium]|nr:DUF523 and DUF1722 domain-containing protein [Anaerolineae bacterium]